MGLFLRILAGCHFSAGTGIINWLADNSVDFVDSMTIMRLFVVKAKALILLF
jgi:hypothetical protein